MQILASDFDNTLYVIDPEIVKENIKSIKKFISSGNVFCIITGRNYSDIKVLLTEYDIPYSYLICEDGAKIFNNMDYCLETNMLESKKVEKIIEILEKNSCPYFLDDGYNITTNKDDCVKIVIKTKNVIKAPEILNRIKQEVDVYAYISSEHINIVDIKVNKCNALKSLLKLEHLPSEQLNVIGDNINDLEMLQTFNGAIMREHSKELDSLNKKEYNKLSEFIEELSKK